MFQQKIIWDLALSALTAALSLGTAEATPAQAIVGSWCLDVTLNGVTRPAVINFSSDGNITTIPGTPFPTPPITDSTDRSPGIGEVHKIGPGQWEAVFQIFLTKLGSPASNYNGRQAIILPIIMESDGSISDGGNGLTINVYDKNDVFLTTITGSYTGRRLDP